jgi:hypothetical protein
MRTQRKENSLVEWTLERRMDYSDKLIIHQNANTGKRLLAL